jgi:hypothetical protein
MAHIPMICKSRVQGLGFGRMEGVKFNVRRQRTRLVANLYCWVGLRGLNPLGFYLDAELLV